MNLDILNQSHGLCTSSIGECGDVDGLYYVDERTFAFCSHGQKTLQACAEGSANPPIEDFQPGGYYTMYEFCSVNLVAQGYVPSYATPVAPTYKASTYEGDAGYSEEVHAMEDGIYAYQKPDSEP